MVQIALNSSSIKTHRAFSGCISSWIIAKSNSYLPKIVSCYFVPSKTLKFVANSIFIINTHLVVNLNVKLESIKSLNELGHCLHGKCLNGLSLWLFVNDLLLCNSRKGKLFLAGFAGFGRKIGLPD